ncbi:MAG: hypothetical protein ACSHX9_01595 [Luteolibacter sp.]
MKKYNEQQKNNSKRQTEAQRLANLAGPAEELDAICRRRLPDGLIRSGVLEGRESEIRQEALIMCLSGYLEGSSRYRVARASKDSQSIELEMTRCVSIAMRHCKARMQKKLNIQNGRNILIDEINGGHCVHPSDWQTEDWPSAVRVEVMLRAVDEAVHSGKLSAVNAGILGMVVVDGKSVEEIAESMKVSQSAIYQQMRRVRKILPELMERFEP